MQFRTIFSFFTIFMALFLFSSCNKDDDTEDAIPFAELNGTWTGQTRILQAGSCVSADPAWNDVELDITVNVDGSFQVVEERQFDTSDDTWYPSNSQWQGVIKENDSIFVTKTLLIDCFGVDNIENTDYQSKLTRTSNSLNFNISGVEVFCPVQNCVFDRDYRMSKTN